MKTLSRLIELLDENPELSIDEATNILVQEGYIKDKNKLLKLFHIVGVE